MKEKLISLWQQLAVRSCLLNILITSILIGIFASVSTPGADLLGVPGMLGAALSFVVVAFWARRKRPESARRDSFQAALGALAGTALVIIVIGMLFAAELRILFQETP